MTLMRASAFCWWNAHIDDVSDSTDSPVVVFPSVACAIWKKICPIFLCFVIDDNDIGKYWESIRVIVRRFENGDDVPSPITHFPEFITRLFSIRHVMCPKTVDDCVDFTNKFGFRKSESAHFFLYQSPIFFGNPVRCLETMVALQLEGNSLWKSFAKRPSSVDAFFEMYVSMCSPISYNSSQEAWRHRTALVSVMGELVHDVFQWHENIVTLSERFLDCAIPLIHAPIEPAGRVLRVVLSTIMALANTMSRSAIRLRICRILELLDRTDSPHCLAAFRFILAMEERWMVNGIVVRIVELRGIRSIADFEILRLAVDATSVIQVLTLLFKCSIWNSIWHRACVSEVLDLIVRFPGQVRSYVVEVVRKLFVFIAVSHQRRRYKGRAIILCETLALLEAQDDIPWLHHIVAACAAAVASYKTPSYFSAFFPDFGRAIDEDTIHEIMSSPLIQDLKHFPFGEDEWVAKKERGRVKVTRKEARVHHNVRVARPKRVKNLRKSMPILAPKAGPAIVTLRPRHR